MPPRLRRDLGPVVALLLWAAGFVALVSCGPSEETVRVAVAANFTEPAQDIARLFEQQTGHRSVLSFGSTGQFFAQITQEAPFDVFLAADQETPARVAAAGLGEPDSVFTYAVGAIVLYSTSIDLSDGEAVLREGRFERIAIANPETAPYGAAAREALEALGLHGPLGGRIVQGNNITQAFQFVETGNAEVGFVALSQVAGRNPDSFWVVPENLYTPIRQDAVLLRPGIDKPGARAFLAFLRSPEIVNLVESYGYRTVQ